MCRLFVFVSKLGASVCTHGEYSSFYQHHFKFIPVDICGPVGFFGGVRRGWTLGERLFKKVMGIASYIGKLKIGRGRIACASHHQYPEIFEVRRPKLSWKACVVGTYLGRQPYYFTHHGASAHHAYRCKGDVRDADVAPGHKQVVYISGIQAPVGDGAYRRFFLVAYAFEFASGKELVVFRLGIVDVYRPGCGTSAVGELDVSQYVVSAQYIIAHQAAALALAAVERDPIEGAAFEFFTERCFVLDVRPVCVNCQHSVVAYLLCLEYLVAEHSRLPGPGTLCHALAALLVKDYAVFEFRKTARGWIFLGTPL